MVQNFFAWMILWKLRLSDAELIDAAAEMILETEHITVAMLQRRFNKRAHDSR